MAMRGPRVPIDHPDRRSLCEEALEVRFFELIEERQLMVLLDEALAVGWQRRSPGWRAQSFSCQGA
jgi:hypothetical protein